jgi:hypothetical protein
MVILKESLSDEELKKRTELVQDTIELIKRLGDKIAKSYAEGEVPRIKSRDEIYNSNSR